MFRTKRDVDRHVRNVLGRIKEEKERNARGFQFAKLYYDVKDYDSAKKYLQAYLNIRESLPMPHKLMGQVCEGLKDKIAAVDAYKRSLDLDPDQKDVLLKVCELYGDSSVYVNPESAKYWVEQAEQHFPNDFKIFKLKERIAEDQGQGDTGELELLISKELQKNPSNVKLHVKLIRLYLQTEEVEKAYVHAVKTEKTLAFPSSEDWYNCLFDTYQEYQNLHGCKGNIEFFTNKLYTLATLTYLRLQGDDRNLINCVEVLQQFDEDLNKVSQTRIHNEEWDAFLLEMKGQFFFLIGTLLLKRAKKSQLSWKDSARLSAVCYLISCSMIPDSKADWVFRAPKEKKKFIERLQFIGSYRLSQGGNVIRSMSKHESSSWARQLRQKLCTQQGRDHLYDIIFTSPDTRRSQQHSFLLSSDIFLQTDLDIPSRAQITTHDSVSYRFHADQLEELVWLALQHHSLSDETQQDYQKLFGFQLFKDMKYSVQDLSNGDPSSLSQLDVQVYFWTCVRWAAIQQRDRKRNLHKIPDKPPLLPSCLNQTLCTTQQVEWWEAVYKMENQTAGENLSKLWGVLVRGLETIRLISPNTLPLGLMIHLAETLEERVKEIERLGTGGLVPPKLAALQARAAFYWKAAMSILVRLERNQTVWLPKESLFPGEMPSDAGQIRKYKERTQLALGIVEMRDGNYENSLKRFETLTVPEASFHTGKIYKMMAEMEDRNGNSSKSQESSQQIALLARAKGALYQALDRLEDKNQELEEVVKRDLDDVISKLITLESGGDLLDGVATNHTVSTEESQEESEEDDEKPAMYSTPVRQSQSSQSMLSTKYPSPTRLEYQLKSMEQSNQALVSRLDQLEEIVRANQKNTEFLQELLRESKEENKYLREQVQMAVLQQNSINMGRPSLPAFPSTPAHVAAMSHSFQAQSQQYDFPGAGSIPTHISQYGYGMGSPARPSSIFGAQEDFEDDTRHIDGEYYEGELASGAGQYGVPDSGLVQDWPFGHKAGVEGKSTITYAPQGRSMNQMNSASAGMFANALRGQSIQYSNYQQPRGPPSTIPGPGYFAQPPQQQCGAFPMSQAGGALPQPGQQPTGYPAHPGQAAYNPQFPQGPQQGQQYLIGALTKSPAMSPAVPNPNMSLPSSVSTQPASCMMPPNAVASSSLSTKPRLIPGSVGVTPPPIGSSPAPKPPTQQGSIFPQSMTSTASSASPQVSAFGGSPASSKPSSQPVSFPGQMPTSSQSSGFSAATTLQALASRHKSDQQQMEEKKAQVPVSSQNTLTPPQKFGGFTFTSTPIVKDASKEDKPKAVPAKSVAKTTPSTTVATQKPFSGFSFTTPTTAAKTMPTTTASSKPQPSTTSVILGQSSSVSSLSFGSVAATGSPDTLKAGGDAKGFAGAGTPVFRSPGSPRKTNRSTSEDDHVEEYEPNVDFQPVVPLPALVDVKTGEEDEEKMFGERAKLFRFDKDTNQWKERGVGEMKIMRHMQTKRVRILMRREQVLKLCANHNLTKDIRLAPMSTSDKAWIWSAMDYSEEEMKLEKFAIRFKTSDVAGKFKEVFEKCQADIAKQEEESEGSDSKPEKSSTADNKSEGKKNELTALFKKPSGSWNCDGCLISNGADVLRCPCCNTLKPGVKADDIKEEPAANKFGSTSGSGFKFGSSGFSFGSPSVADAKPTGGFSFGVSTASSQASSASGTGFTFGGQSATEASASVTGGGFKFGSTSVASSSGFNLTSATETKSAGFAVDTKASSFVFGTGSTVSSKLETSTAVSSSTSSSLQKAADTSKPLSAVFQVKAGSWKCEGCLVTVEGECDKCPCCSTPKAGLKENPSASANAVNALSKLASASPAGSGFNLAKMGSKESGTKGFSFGEEKSSATGFVFGSTATQPASNLETSKPSGFVFGTPTKSDSSTKPAVKGFDFATASKGAEPFKFSMEPIEQKPATIGSPFTFTKSPNSKSGPQKSLGVTSPKSPEISEDGYYLNKEGDDSHIYFEPVIELPQLVPVSTGEEDEECLFNHRAKLYRFTGGEWKERGLGNIKILYNMDTNKARVLMRREQILKLCCNHYIEAEMNMKPMPNTDGKALIWFAVDFADGDQKHEQLSVRFKTAEIAGDFVKAFEDAKSRVKGQDSGLLASSKNKTGRAVIAAAGNAESDDDVVIILEELATPEEVQKAREFLLPDNFYLYTRRPDCPGCRGCRDSDDEDEEVEEDVEDEEETDEEGVEENSGFKSSGSSYLAQLLSEETPKEDLINKVLETSKDKKSTSPAPAGGEFVLGSGEISSFSFSALAATADPTAFTKDPSKPFQWKGAGQMLFSHTPKTQPTDSGDEDTVEEGEDPHFEPVVPLPELVEVKTGEEDEEAMFSSRAKLFRFDTAGKQWKEKGIGEMKILKHKQTGHHRLLLRREQVFKLACNHRLSPALSLKPMNVSETSWCWTAQDFSEGEPKLEQLAVKFKTIEQAKQFKDAFEAAKKAESEIEEIKTPTQETGDGEEESSKGVEVETVGPKSGSQLERLLSEDD